MRPETNYAPLGQERIAYQVLGEGPPDLVLTPGSFGHVEITWEDPGIALFLRSLASFSRLILFDRLGTGASDPLPPDSLPPWKSHAEELSAVLEEVGSEQTALLARTRRRPYGGVLQRDQTKARQRTQPRRRCRFGRWFTKLQRLGASPRTVQAFLRAVLEVDVRPLLPLIHAPALVLHPRDYPAIPIQHGRHLPSTSGAKLVELPGADASLVWEAPELALDLIEKFLTGVRRPAKPSRVLATVLFTDIVGSTAQASRLGDRRWRELLNAHDEVARRLVEEFGGRLVQTTGDGILATFDGPGRGIGCATALREKLNGISLQIRAGLHTGEVELRERDIEGIAVHIASRVMAAAGPGEILTSRAHHL